MRAALAGAAQPIRRERPGAEAFPSLQDKSKLPRSGLAFEDYILEAGGSQILLKLLCENG